MNKEEAKEELVKNSWSFADPESESRVVDLKSTLNIIDQIELDQPKKEVPQMIFDVIESFDEDKDYLHQHMSRQPSEVREWLTHNERDFYEAWLAYPNITVEKEKLYQIIDKRLDVTFNCLGYVIEDGVWFWANKKAFLSNENVRLDHTKQQLIDAGFEEVFENPNYEVKEDTE